MDRFFWFAALAANQGKSSTVSPGPAGKTSEPREGRRAWSSHACNGQGADPSPGASITHRREEMSLGLTIWGVHSFFLLGVLCVTQAVPPFHQL